MARTIDGFMPRTTPVVPHVPTRNVLATRPAAIHHTPVAPLARPLQAQPRRQPARPALQPPPTTKPIPPATPVPPRRAYAKSQPAATRRRGIPERLQLPLIILGAMLAGIFAQSAVFGEIVLAAYGVAALVWNVASRTTFTLALLSMVATTLLLVVRGNVTLAQNFATYTFLLLVVGVITLIRELKKEGGRVYSNRKNII